MCCVFGLSYCLEEIKIHKVVWICSKTTHHLKRELLNLGKKKFELKDSTVSVQKSIFMLKLLSFSKLDRHKIYLGDYSSYYKSVSGYFLVVFFVCFCEISLARLNLWKMVKNAFNQVKINI